MASLFYSMMTCSYLVLVNRAHMKRRACSQCVNPALIKASTQYGIICPVPLCEVLLSCAMCVSVHCIILVFQCHQNYLLEVIKVILISWVTWILSKCSGLLGFLTISFLKVLSSRNWSSFLLELHCKSSQITVSMTWHIKPNVRGVLDLPCS